MAVRSVVMAAVALVIGVILGTLPERYGTRALEEQLAEAQAKDCRKGVGRDLAKMFSGRPPLVDPEPEPDEADEPAADGSGPETPSDEDAGRPGPPERRQVGPDGRIELPDRIDPEQVETAKTVLDLRRIQAREALIEAAGPDDVELAEVDASVAQMNVDLRDIAEHLVELGADGELTRRDTMQFAEDTLAVFNEAETRIRTALGDKADFVDDRSLDPFSWVDPALLDLFAELDQ